LEESFDHRRARAVALLLPDHAAQIRREDLIALLSDALPLAEKSPQLNLAFDET
jgi:hypothetical protein